MCRESTEPIVVRFCCLLPSRKTKNEKHISHRFVESSQVTGDCSDCGDENSWTCLTCGVGPPPASSATAIGVAAGEWTLGSLWTVWGGEIQIWIFFGRSQQVEFERIYGSL